MSGEVRMFPGRVGNLGAGFVFAWLLIMTSMATAQMQPAQTTDAASFDVATIKPSHATDGHSHIYNHAEIGEFSTINVSIKMLMQFAYELPETRILGGPPWMNSATFDVQAKTTSELAEHLHQLTFNEATSETRKMVQTLLSDRFQLQVHIEKRELPVYKLVVAKGGAKLGAVQTSGTTINTGHDHLQVQGADSVELLSDQLAKVLGRVVLNQTGLVGRYDLRIKWAPDDSAEATGPSIFTAIEEQLGLKLEPAKAPVEVTVVDHVSMPSEN
jgi:uncharacterized protein (TIGR03435 family)